MRRCVATLLRTMAAAFAMSALLTAVTSSPAAAACPTPSDTKPLTVTDLEVTTPCNVAKGNYYYANVNIYGGGVLNFLDETIDFWAKAIIVEANGSLIAGALPPDPKSPCANPAQRPIGCAGGVVTIHLYGQGPANPTDPLAGARCKSPDQRCGVPFEWSDHPASKVQLPPTAAPITDYFYKYGTLPKDNADTSAYYGTKVLGVGYGGTLKLFGAKGATYCKDGAVQCPLEIPSSDSGTSWRRLAVDLPKNDTDKKLTVDRAVDWVAKDRVVVTTTDYLPGHSEVLEITGGSGTQFTYVKVNESTGVPTSDGVTWAHNGTSYPLDAAGIDRLKLVITDTDGKSRAETRAAVGLLTRSIRIVSGGDNHGDEFPAEPPAGSRAAGYYFGGHTLARQGFQDYQVQGVEFRQLGQGGRLGHYPVHFHLARTTAADKTKPRAFVKDSSIHDSMTRWIVLHGTHNVLLERNVGYQSIGHGYYLEDGTEIENQFHSNIGIFARAAIENPNGSAHPHNPRKVPGILAAKIQNPWPPPAKTPWAADAIPFYTDFDHPTVFWIMNGWNDFEYNMAAGAGTCGVCYWLVPGANSGHSQHQIWDSYAALQQASPMPNVSAVDRASSTPLKKFVGNYCTSAMNSFNTIANATQCNGVGDSVDRRPPNFVPVENPLAPLPCDPTNPATGDFAPFACNKAGNEKADEYWPKVDQGGGRFATRCDDPAACASLSRCGAGHLDNCEVTVLDRYTSSFHLGIDTNFSTLWLRPQWYLFVNSVLSDVQYGGLTFVTGGGYTASDVVPGHWALARKSAFIGTTQQDNPFASAAGPVNPKSKKQDSNLVCEHGEGEGNHCLVRAEGISIPIANLSAGQRLFNIYDGPAYQDANAYLDITPVVLEDCKPFPNTCSDQTPCVCTKNSDCKSGVCTATGQCTCDPAHACTKNSDCKSGVCNMTSKLCDPLFACPGNIGCVDGLCALPGYNCRSSDYSGAWPSGVPQDDAGKCYMPNAGIAWKQPNGFYYPPAFHSAKLFFHNVPIRHFVVEPEFLPGTYKTNALSSLKRYCSFEPTMFDSFTDIDRQTELSDDDGSLTGFVKTVSVNLDPFFNAPVETVECASDVTAKTSPYEYVTTVVYPGCAAKDANNCNQDHWRSQCTVPNCNGVPLYRQFTTWAETAADQGPGIRMAGQDTFQRSTLTVNHGKYYIDTAVDEKTQRAWAPGAGLNLFEAGKVYYVFDVFATPTTKQTFQLYVGTGFKKDTDVWATKASTAARPISFTKPGEIALPAGWEVKYGAPDLPDGVLQVTMDMGFPEFKTAYDGSFEEHCKPANFCEWNSTTKACGCSAKLKTNDPDLYKECEKDDHRICAVWAVKDVDCPQGKCYGVGVKLAGGFDYAAGQAVRKDPLLKAKPFPLIDDWNVAFHEAPADLAGVCAPKPFDISNFYGQATNVGSIGKGYLTLKGSFTPPASFHLTDAQSITLNALLYGDKELVSGFGANTRPLPLSLVRRSDPAAGWDATFVSAKTRDLKANISPVSQLNIKAMDGGRFNFQLAVGTGPIGDISIAEPQGCPRRSPDVQLHTAFNIFGGVDPIDVAVNGEWDCADDKQYNGHN